jgi:hypothetical protein
MQCELFLFRGFGNSGKKFGIYTLMSSKLRGHERVSLMSSGTISPKNPIEKTVPRFGIRKRKIEFIYTDAFFYLHMPCLDRNAFCP